MLQYYSDVLTITVLNSTPRSTSKCATLLFNPLLFFLVYFFARTMEIWLFVPVDRYSCRCKLLESNTCVAEDEYSSTTTASS